MDGMCEIMTKPERESLETAGVQPGSNPAPSTLLLITIKL